MATALTMAEVWHRAWRKLRIIACVQTARRDWARLRTADAVKLELGAGRKRGAQGWTTVDLFGADITHDMRRRIPMPPSSVDAIYTSHALEHFYFDQVIAILRDCHRVLKSGGTLSVCVPNAGYYLRAYAQGTEFFPQEHLYQPALIKTGSHIDQVNYIAYMCGRHRYMFDEENLINTIRKAGFGNVKLRAFDPALDLARRDFESIYALAVK
ncbi:MAG: methyltransferase domain-containing protein [Geminicoccaceae bacterium]